MKGLSWETSLKWPEKLNLEMCSQTEGCWLVKASAFWCKLAGNLMLLPPTYNCLFQDFYLWLQRSRNWVYSCLGRFHVVVFLPLGNKKDLINTLKWFPWTNSVLQSPFNIARSILEYNEEVFVILLQVFFFLLLLLNILENLSTFWVKLISPLLLFRTTKRGPSGPFGGMLDDWWEKDTLKKKYKKNTDLLVFNWFF